MSTQTLNKSAAVEYFKQKLEFEIGPVELKQRLDKGERLQVIDLRTQDLYNKAHVPSAVRADLENIEAVAAKFKKEEAVVVYCYNFTCQLSARAALHLAEKGYKVRELLGGWESWSKNEFATEAGTKTGGCCGA